jgi:transposase
LIRGDLTNAQWRILDSLLPDRGERGPAIVEKRRTVNGILWVLRKMLFSYAHPLFWAPYSIIGDGGGG